MKLFMQVVFGLVLAGTPALIFAARPSAPSAAPDEVSFQFERPGLPVPRFTIRVHEDGTGSYVAEEEEGLADGEIVRYASAKQINRTMSLTPATVTKIFNTARELKYFDMDCNLKSKKIANTGKKTLSYTGSAGAGSCTYNFSENKEVMALTDTFLGIAYTMDEGRRLEYLHRYDRLGLDAAMISLQDAAKAGRAIELGTIAQDLTSIAGDTAVMERVRLRASKLLERAKDGSKI